MIHDLSSLLLAADAAPAQSPLQGMLPIILMVAVIYFIVLRPMSKQEKDRKKRLESLKKGEQVVLGGGIVGRLSNVDDDKIWTVEIADRVKVRVLKKDITDTLESALASDARGGAKSDSGKSDKDGADKGKADKDKADGKAAKA